MLNTKDNLIVLTCMRITTLVQCLLIGCFLFVVGLGLYSLYLQWVGAQLELGNWIITPNGILGFSTNSTNGTQMGVRTAFDIKLNTGGSYLFDIIHERGTAVFPVEIGAFWYCSLISTAVLLSVAFLIIFYLRRILFSFQQGAPFVRSNVDRLRRIALLMFGGMLLNETIIYFQSKQVARLFDAVEGLSQKTAFNIETQWLLIPLLTLVVAEFLRIGLEIAEENQLTI